MTSIGNLLWFILGGCLTALTWLVLGCIAFVSVVFMPFAPACFRLAKFSAAPFGQDIVDRRLLDARAGDAAVSSVLNVLWFVLFGWWVALAFALAGLTCCVTVIGIPFGLAYFKLADAACWPVGREVVNKDVARVARENQARAALAARQAKPV